jgi:hypothetical protein
MGHEAEQTTDEAFLTRTRRILFDKKFIAATLVFMIATSLLWPHPDNASHESSAADKDNTSPDYQTVLPRGESASEFGGWQRVSPPQNDPVFAYADNIDGVAISVSEQPLPDSFKGDVDGKMADLAQKFNATDKLSADDTAVYVGTSVKGPQSTLFTMKNVLVMIKSQKKIADASWTDYVKSLRTPDDSSVPKY